MSANNLRNLPSHIHFFVSGRSWINRILISEVLKLIFIHSESPEIYHLLLKIIHLQYWPPRIFYLWISFAFYMLEFSVLKCTCFKPWSCALPCDLISLTYQRTPVLFSLLHSFPVKKKIFEVSYGF